jgi:hypothetical protein
LKRKISDGRFSCPPFQACCHSWTPHFFCKSFDVTFRQILTAG